MPNETKRQPPPPPKPPAAPGTPPPLKTILPWIVVMTLMVGMLFAFSRSADPYEVLPYSAPDHPSLAQLVKDGLIAKAEIIREVSGIQYVKYELKKDAQIKTDGGKSKFKTYITIADHDFVSWLQGSGADVSVPPQNPLLWQILTSVLPVLLIFGLIYFLFIRQMRAAGHGALSFGKSRARLLNRDKNRVTFKDVAGIDEAREEVQEIVDFLKDPKKFTKVGGRIPKGVMLMGPPGTGKTLLAKAIAGEAEVPFFSISGSDFVEMFVGVGASRVRDMFEQGKRNAPCIIFIDEIDAVGRSRFTGIGGGHDEREQTLNALLVEMDGFETEEGVIILAATNRPDVLDPALQRPGRFDRQIVIDLPLIDGREQILKIHSKGIRLGDDVELLRTARGTPGFSGADLENLMNEAALLAGRKNKAVVEMADLEEARDKVMWGRERRSRVLDAKERELTAYHEGGHALVQVVAPEAEPVHKVTIMPRGVAYLGATMSLPDKDRFTESRTKLMGTLAALMGGRSAEEIVFSEITTGAAQDIKQATAIARMMVCDWGMSDELGPQRFGENKELMFLGREVARDQTVSEETARKIDAEVGRLLHESHARARKILESHREKLDLIAQRLLECETIDGRDVVDLVHHGRVLSETERNAIDRAQDAADSAGTAPQAPPPGAATEPPPTGAPETAAADVGQKG